MNRCRNFTVCVLLFCQIELFADFTHPKYIWNLGQAMSCDISPFKNGLPLNYQTYPSPDYIDPRTYVKNVKNGDTIWVQSHQLANFYYNVLPTITSSFILLINDGDDTFPTSYYDKLDVNALVNDSRVIHIFGQNVDCSQSSNPLIRKKVSGVPIGIDFHTVAHCSNCSIFGETQKTYQQQESQLDDLLITLKPTHQRIKKAFVDFHLADRGTFDGESRTSIFHQIYPTGLIDAPTQRMPRDLLWKTKGNYAFSISPRGNGLDCHRTWEDLLLGCIVIVKTSPLDDLYQDLPVVIIKDWSEINEENLTKWLNQFADAFTNPNYRKRLTNQFWRNIIKTKQIKIESAKNSELDHLIPPEIKNDKFYHSIYSLARTLPIKTILEIGSSSGEGSTEAFVLGLHTNPMKPRLFCMEVSEVRFAALKKHYENNPAVFCYNVSSVPLTSFPTEKEIDFFYHNTPTSLNGYPLDRVIGWLKQDIEYIQSHAIEQNGISLIKKENGIENFDLVLIDGSEFTGIPELNQIYGAKYILLDDINAYKNYTNWKRLSQDPNYVLIEENLHTRNGYAIFGKTR